jgi:hypothetical protein
MEYEIKKMTDDREFTFKIIDGAGGSILFKVQEVKGRKVQMEEFLGVIAAYLHEACGDEGLLFADDIEDDFKNIQ